MSGEQNQIDNESQKQQEQCPFCKFPVPNGASVCMGCGARRETKKEVTPLAQPCGAFAGGFLMGCGVGMASSATYGFITFAVVTGLLFYYGATVTGYTDRWLRQQ